MELYKIDAAIMSCIDPETGEITDMEKLDSLEMEKDATIENIVMLRKNLLADIGGIDAEVKALTELKKSKQTYIERLEGWVNNSLGGQNYHPASGLFDIKFTKSQETVVLDEKALKDFDFAGRFFRAKFEPNKSEIKKALKAGENVVGCALVDKTNMNIK